MKVKIDLDESFLGSETEAKTISDLRWSEWSDPRNAARLARVIRMLDARDEALGAVLLWFKLSFSDADIEAFLATVGGTECTSKALCDHIRRVLRKDGQREPRRC